MSDSISKSRFDELHLGEAPSADRNRDTDVCKGADVGNIVISISLVVTTGSTEFPLAASIGSFERFLRSNIRGYESFLGIFIAINGICRLLCTVVG